MVKEGIPFVSAFAILALIFVIVQILFGISVLLWFAAGACIFLAMFMAYFFRDPKRTIPTEEGIVVSAADGRVTRIDENDSGKFVSVFLSPLDVHINRSPIAGKIDAAEYVKGRKVPATSNNASFVNERNSLTIKGDKITIVCTQIAGILARRIVCWNKAGDSLKRGEKFGLIKFSSRTDLLMPKNVEIVVNVGDRVYGGETVIARFGSAADQLLQNG